MTTKKPPKTGRRDSKLGTKSAYPSSWSRKPNQYVLVSSTTATVGTRNTGSGLEFTYAAGGKGSKETLLKGVGAWASVDNKK